MANMRRDNQVIAGPERSSGGLAFNEDSSGSTNQQHELVPALVEPEAARAGLSCRDDALNPDAGQSQQRLNPLFARGEIECREKVVLPDLHDRIQGRAAADRNISRQEFPVAGTPDSNDRG